MNRKNYIATLFVAVLCLLTSGCYNIEHEIFLEPDGSGDMVMYMSMPDFPAMMDAMKDLKKDGSNPQEDLQKLIDEIKQKFTNELPPTIKLKEVKEVRRHGAFAYYIVLRFNQLSDVNSMIDKFVKEGLSKAAPSAASKIESFWKIQMEKAGDLTMITQSFYFDFEAIGEALEKGKKEGEKALSDSPAPPKSQASVTPKSGSKPARKAPTRRTPPSDELVTPKADPAFDDAMKALFSEGLISMLVSSILKMRFVLHAPKNITETNADIVLNGKIAIWNASLGAFITEKKPVEMKVTY
jgi:hypothetical protein